MRVERRLGGEVLGEVPGLGVPVLRQLRIGDADRQLAANRQRMADQEQFHTGVLPRQPTRWVRRPRTGPATMDGPASTQRGGEGDAVLPEPDANNVWRLETPGNEGWLRSARPDAADKFFMASADGHVQEPGDLWVTRIDAEVPRSAARHHRRRQGRPVPEDRGFPGRPSMQNVPLEGHELLRNKSGRTPEDRIRDLALDGVDAEVLFPNKGLTIWATPDAEFSQAMCRVYNDWAWETFGPYNDRLVADGLRGHRRPRRARSPRSSAARRSASAACRCPASRSSGRPTTRT